MIGLLLNKVQSIAETLHRPLASLHHPVNPV
jgi:hypothetical protein